MPRLWITSCLTACLTVLASSRLAAAEPAPMSKATNPPAVAPALPNAALLEFVADWTEQERELLNMDEQTEQSKQAQEATAKNRRARADAR